MLQRFCFKLLFGNLRTLFRYLVRLPLQARVFSSSGLNGPRKTEDKSLERKTKVRTGVAYNSGSSLEKRGEGK